MSGSILKVGAALGGVCLRPGGPSSSEPFLFAALSMHINPPSNREFVDPKTLHLSAEFTEENGGRASTATAASSHG